MDRLYWRPSGRGTPDDAFWRGRGRRWPKRAKAGCWTASHSHTQPIKWRRSTISNGWTTVRAHAVAKPYAARACRRAASKRELWPGTGNRKVFAVRAVDRTVTVVRTYAKNRRKYGGNGRRRAVPYACVLPTGPPIFTGVAAGSQQQAVMDPTAFLMCCGRCHRQPVLCGFHLENRIYAGVMCSGCEWRLMSSSRGRYFLRGAARVPSPARPMLFTARRDGARYCL